VGTAETAGRLPGGSDSSRGWFPPPLLIPRRTPPLPEASTSTAPPNRRPACSMPLAGGPDLSFAMYPTASGRPAAARPPSGSWRPDDRVYMFRSDTCPGRRRRRPDRRGGVGLDILPLFEGQMEHHRPEPGLRVSKLHPARRQHTPGQLQLRRPPPDRFAVPANEVIGDEDIFILTTKRDGDREQGSVAGGGRGTRGERLARMEECE
jgi:hypothetical protein